MKILCLSSAVFLIAGSSVLFCQSAAGNCDAAVQSPVKTSTTLEIDSRSAGIDIVGTDDMAVKVSCTLGEPSRARDVKIKLSANGSGERLKVEGGPNGNVQIRVEVPWSTNLRVHLPAGEVKVNHVAGDKDIALYAGQIVVSRVDDTEYRSIDASAKVGQVSAKEYHVDKGGFFRSFTRKNAEGKYRLRARVTTGSVVLN